MLRRYIACYMDALIGLAAENGVQVRVYAARRRG